MTLVIDLQPDIERRLLARAQAKGVSLADFAQEVLARELLPVDRQQQTGTRTGREFPRSNPLGVECHPDFPLPKAAFRIFWLYDVTGR